MERVIVGHCQYAKRQRTWLRGEEGLIRVSGLEEARRAVAGFLPPR